jgi:RNA polymerase sigma-70 factor (ECF subfamily)
MTHRPHLDLDELLAQARAGEAAALGQLLGRYRNYLTLLARQQIGPRLQGKVDASDLVQETFLAAHRNFVLFRGSGERELVGWLRQILVTQLALHVRRYLGTQRRDARLEQQLADALEQSSAVLDRGLVDPASSPSQRAARRERVVLLADALERLPADYRAVIVWRHLDGLPFADVAQRMGRSVESVKSLWARALARLRCTLRDLP